MKEKRRISSGIAIPMTLENICLDLNNVIEQLKSYTGSNKNIQTLLSNLHSVLANLNQILPTIYDGKKDDEGTVIELMTKIVDEKRGCDELLDTLPQIDLTISHVLDIVEETVLPNVKVDFDPLLDIIEEVSTLIHESIEPKLKVIKSVIDIALEYDEISTDNMDTLNNIINENINNLFRIQEERFSSPVRHAPSFTLDQLIKLLAPTPDNSTEPKLPKFSQMEDKLSRQYMELRKNIAPIEKSLIDILPQRMQQFKNRRDFKQVNILTMALTNKYNEIMRNFKFLSNEIRHLKIDLIDKRWNILFKNLNHELEYILDEMDYIYDNLSNNKYSKDLRLKFKLQLDQKTKIISRTFNIIYKAIEFSLLDAGVATTTNNLAQRWLDIRPRTDELLLALDMEKLKIIDTKLTPNKNQAVKSLYPPELSALLPPPSLSGKHNYSSDSESDSGNRTIDLIKDDLRKFSLTSNSKVKTKRSVGAKLLNKMNIKPIILGDSGNDNEQNPFFDPSSKNSKKSNQTLIFNTVPKLPFDDSNSFPNNNSSIHSFSDSFNSESDEESSIIISHTQSITDLSVQISKEHRNEQNTQLLGNPIYLVKDSDKSTEKPTSLVKGHTEAIDMVTISKQEPNSIKEPPKLADIHKHNSISKTIYELELDKVKFYAKQKSKIPRLKPELIGHQFNNIRKDGIVFQTPPHSMYNIQNSYWVPSTKRSIHRLKPPTPISQLLSPISH